MALVLLTLVVWAVPKSSLAFSIEGNIVDSMTKTVKVRIDADNRDGALKPEMFADVTLSEPQRDVTAVPQSAVINTGTRSIVFVVDEKGTFQPREVATGTSDGNFIEIRSGLSAGEKVATGANFLLDSESRLRSVIEKQKAESREQK